MFEKADVLIEGEHDTRGARRSSILTGHSLVDATGLLVLPGGIDVHTHLDMPFGGTVSADDYSHRHAGCGHRRNDDDRRFRPAGKGTRMRDALDIWRAKAEDKACIDLWSAHDRDRSGIR